MQTEKQLQQYIVKKLKAAGAMCHKMESRSARGWPDLICIYYGRCAFVEIKSPAGTGKLSELQKRCMANLLAHKMNVFLVDSKELADELIGWVLDD